MGSSTVYARILLRRLYRTATENGISLSESLSLFADARIDATSTGGQIQSTSSNGTSVTFSSPTGSFSQEDMAETAGRLLDLYDTVSASVTTGDAAIYAAMLLRLKPARSVSPTFTTLRCA